MQETLHVTIIIIIVIFNVINSFLIFCGNRDTYFQDLLMKRSSKEEFFCNNVSLSFLLNPLDPECYVKFTQFLRNGSPKKSPFLVQLKENGF